MLSSGVFTLLLAGLAVAGPVWPRYTVGPEHLEVLQMRASTSVNPAAVRETKCINSKVNIAFHDENVAQLGICGGIAGKITNTTGVSGTAKFTVNTATNGGTINVSKGRWEQCIRAARAVCPTGSMSATCAGGASNGDIKFTLDNP
ncbi:uncharacterized protein PG998_002133 [Apiospora kogelbergensis]|uniref:uncharacterized protein n=1 Tax=Apiospora kogelbergensis TaxID=1337665 RepID=UPI0031310843